MTEHMTPDRPAFDEALVFVEHQMATFPPYTSEDEKRALDALRAYADSRDRLVALQASPRRWQGCSFGVENAVGTVVGFRVLAYDDHTEEFVDGFVMDLKKPLDEQLRKLCEWVQRLPDLT